MPAILYIFLFGLYFIYGKRIRNKYDKGKVETYIDSADKIALNKLELLSKESYDTKIKIKEFYIKISYILREYVENSVYIHFEYFLFQNKIMTRKIRKKEPI